MLTSCAYSILSTACCQECVCTLSDTSFEQTCQVLDTVCGCIRDSPIWYNMGRLTAPAHDSHKKTAGIRLILPGVASDTGRPASTGATGFQIVVGGVTWLPGRAGGRRAKGGAAVESLMFQGSL